MHLWVFGRVGYFHSKFYRVLDIITVKSIKLKKPWKVIQKICKHKFPYEKFAREKCGVSLWFSVGHVSRVGLSESFEWNPKNKLWHIAHIKQPVPVHVLKLADYVRTTLAEIYSLNFLSVSSSVSRRNRWVVVLTDNDWRGHPVLLSVSEKARRWRWG